MKDYSKLFFCLRLNAPIWVDLFKEQREHSKRLICLQFSQYLDIGLSANWLLLLLFEEQRYDSTRLICLRRNERTWEGCPSNAQQDYWRRLIMVDLVDLLITLLWGAEWFSASGAEPALEPNNFWHDELVLNKWCRAGAWTKKLLAWWNGL